MCNSREREELSGSLLAQTYSLNAPIDTMSSSSDIVKGTTGAAKKQRLNVAGSGGIGAKRPNPILWRPSQRKTANQLTCLTSSWQMWRTLCTLLVM